MFSLQTTTGNQSSVESLSDDADGTHLQLNVDQTVHEIGVIPTGDDGLGLDFHACIPLGLVAEPTDICVVCVCVSLCMGTLM